MRTETLKTRYDRDGFVVIPGFKSREAVAELRARAMTFVEAFDPDEAISVASSAEGAQAYFKASGDKIRCFLEDDAFDERGRLRRPKERSIAKIGQAMHVRDRVFERFSRDPGIHELIVELGIEQPLLYQSMYIFKQPQIGSAVRWHHDAPYADDRPIPVTTLWFALECADRGNGCLSVRRGGHVAQRPDTLTSEFVEVNPGAVVVMHGLLPHSSAPNRSERSRDAYTLHVVGAREPWPPRSWYDPVAPPCPIVPPAKATPSERFAR